MARENNGTLTEAGLNVFAYCMFYVLALKNSTSSKPSLCIRGMG